jgi:hypothetical protein
MTEPRRCFHILVGQSHPEYGYVPSLVVENEAGHTPMTGRGELSRPWYWGTEYDRAKQICDQVNQEMFGLSHGDAADIVMSSMAASHRSEARGAQFRVELAEKLGRRADPADVLKAQRDG